MSLGQAAKLGTRTYAHSMETHLKVHESRLPLARVISVLRPEYGVGFVVQMVARYLNATVREGAWE